MENRLRLLHGDCLSKMKNIQPESIDMIFTDLPYGTTQNSWDIKISTKSLWEQFLRIVKPNGVIALWSQMPYSAELVMSMPKLFRYEWIIEKTTATGFLNANRMPMKAHEQVLIFYKNLPTYNPQKTYGHQPTHSFVKKKSDGSNYGKTSLGISGGGDTDRFPRDVLKFSWDTQTSKLHPTQKPLAATEYFIKTYTNVDDVVLDCCMGSGTCGVASANLDRKFVGIEKDSKWFNIASDRINDAYRKHNKPSITNILSGR